MNKSKSGQGGTGTGTGTGSATEELHCSNELPVTSRVHSHKILARCTRSHGEQKDGQILMLPIFSAKLWAVLALQPDFETTQSHGVGRQPLSAMGNRREEELAARLALECGIPSMVPVVYMVSVYIAMPNGTLSVLVAIPALIC